MSNQVSNDLVSNGRRSCFVHVVSLVCALLVGIALQTEASEPVLLNFQEKFKESVPIAGKDYIALGRVSKRGLLVDKGFFADLTSQDFPRMCISIRSRDGKYEGVGQFDISGLDIRRHFFPLRTNYKGHLFKYSWNSLAVQLRLAKDCKVLSDPVSLVTPLDQRHIVKTPLVAFVQSLGARAYLTRKPNQKSEKCERLPGTKSLPSVAFDAACEIGQAVRGLHTIELFDILTNRVGVHRFEIRNAR